MNSRQKGAKGEREAAEHLGKVFGWECIRGQQRSGTECADVLGPDWLHLEVKRTETLRLHDALEQAKRDAKPGQIPVVMYRRNRSDWVWIVAVEDVPRFVELCYLEAAKGI